MSKQLIHSDPDIMGGTPCIKGTRLTVYAVRGRIHAGESVADLLAGYPPEVTEEHVRAAIGYADKVPFAEDPDGRPWRGSGARQNFGALV